MSDPTPGRLPLSAATAIFAGTLAVYAGYWHSRDWNVTSRLLLTFALVQDRSVEVTPFVLREGRFPNDPPTRDLAATPDGRLYCDKAPGQSLWGAPTYALLRSLSVVEPYPHGAPAKAFWPADYWITLGSSGALTAASAVLIAALLIRVGSDLLIAAATSAAYAFSTIALPYATLNYGHAAAGFFPLASLWLWIDRPCTPRRSAAAGMLAGLAVVTEYPLAVFPVCLGAVLFVEAWGSKTSGRRWSGLSSFIAGGIPAMALLGTYHYLATGSPFRLPYSFEVHEEFAYHRQGWGLPVGWPKLDVAWELLVGRRRGLLWYSPILFVAPLGCWKLWRRNRRGLAAVIAGVFLGLLWINAGFPMWDGGWSAGPRFLLPATPLLMLAVGVWLDDPLPWKIPSRILQAVFAGVAIAGAAWTTALTTAGARVHPSVAEPCSQFVRPSIEQGRLEPSVGQWLARQVGLEASNGVAVFWINLAATTAAAGLMLAVAWLARRRQSRTTLPVAADS